MDIAALIAALEGLLLQALPTFFLLLLLHLYLKFVFYRPLEKVLQEREEATEGARKQAAGMVAEAEQKAAEFEAALQKARTEIYQQQDEHRHQLRQDQAAGVAKARASAAESVRRAQAGLDEEVRQARDSLQAESERLAEQICSVVLSTN